MKFSPAFRKQVSSQLTPLLDRFEEVEIILAAEITETKIWQLPSEPSQLVNHYLGMLWAVYISKYHLLWRIILMNYSDHSRENYSKSLKLMC